MLTLIFLRFIGEKYDDGLVKLREKIIEAGLDPDDENANMSVSYMLYIMDKSIGVRRLSFKDDSYIWDLSDINGLLFRENFLVFNKGHYDPNYKILPSVFPKNVTLFTEVNIL